MKKQNLFIIMIIVLFFGVCNVYAKDTVYSMNKYKEEKFTFIKDSYNKDASIDGLIVGGNYLKETIEQEENSYDDYQVILVKYNKNGEIKWTFSHGKTKNDELQDLLYTYDESGNIDGYLIVMEKTYDIDSTEKEETTSFIKVDLEGKIVFEKESGLKNDKINKMIPTYNDEQIVTGYIAIGSIKNDTGIIVRYDKDFKIIWKKEYKNKDAEEISYTDITYIKEDTKITGYVVVREFIKEKKIISSLIQFDLNGKEIKIISETLDKYDSTNLEESNNGFILYGITKEVKLKKGEKSYFLINYSSAGEELWETIGETPTNVESKILLNFKKKDNEITEYLLLYQNSVDSSFEVIKLDIEGMIQKKIKKIVNEYYDIENFLSINNVLYLVGQINCPEDETCDYDDNSLFLVSDEDKVIEVQDNTSRNILIVLGVFIVALCLGIFIKRKKKLI